jgi:hypothetical protein
MKAVVKISLTVETFPLIAVLEMRCAFHNFGIVTWKLDVERVCHFTVLIFQERKTLQKNDLISKYNFFMS